MSTKVKAIMSPRIPVSSLWVPVLLILFLAGCTHECVSPEPEPLVATYTGSGQCAACHPLVNAIWAESGHRCSMVIVEDGAPLASFPAPAAFILDPVDPPLQQGWDQVTYVCGGYGWKMLWLDTDGFTITSGHDMSPVLYCFANRTWVAYGCGFEPGTKPSDCGRCHATGWVPDDDRETDDDFSDNQDGLPGMAGTFVAPGVQCEECHGFGSLHLLDPERFDLLVDSSSADCGRCHFRDRLNRVSAFNRFLLPNAQFDAWRHSSHAISLDGPGCVDCHDPHASVKHDATAAGNGTFATCESCHPEATAVNRHDAFASASCVDCHMPFAVKSGTSFTDYCADMRTHLVDINCEPVGRESGMGLSGGEVFVIADPLTGLVRLTLDLACYGCHQDEMGGGGEAVPLSLGQLSDLAVDIHQPDTSAP